MQRGARRCQQIYYAVGNSTAFFMNHSEGQNEMEMTVSSLREREEGKGTIPLMTGHSGHLVIACRQLDQIVQTLEAMWSRRPDALGVIHCLDGQSRSGLVLVYVLCKARCE